MYISFNWLKDYVKIPAKIKPSDIADGLTGHTVEVENLVSQAEQFDKVVVGRVLEVSKHPNADRLRLATIDIKKTKLKIVCGAPNLAVGQLVPVSLVGAKLPNGLEIKESLIRGEKSSGMICAEDELGLGKNHEGILVLKDNAKVGESFAKYLQVDDTILEVDNKSLSNRPDLLNHYGLAREASAIFDLSLKSYDKFFDQEHDFVPDKENKLEVRIEAKEQCARYLAIKIDNIEIKESPDWLKNRLIAVNQRPLNNIVDLTNYIMLDCGQPLHAFDAANVEKIIVRRALNHESVETLDEKERMLNVNDLVITNGPDIIAIAGVMGGKKSEIKSETKSIILESANFSATSIRKTSQSLGLRTEASVRFEKSLDVRLPEVALKRFLTLLRDICPQMKIASSLVDYHSEEKPVIIIELNLAWLTAKIGQEIPRDFIIISLKKLGFTIVHENIDSLGVAVPIWRATKDISIKEDLAEEILRLYGYEKIVSQLPILAVNLPEVNQERLLERKVKNILTLEHALNEVYNYSFVGEEQLKKLNIDFSQYLKLVNPLSDAQTLLRQSLAPGLIVNIKSNQFKRETFGFVEIGSVFFKAPGNLSKDLNAAETLPYQEKHLGLILAGEDGLFDRLKGIIGSLFKNLINYKAIAEFSVLERVPGWADKNSVASISLFGKEIGLVAAIRSDIALNFNLKKSVVLAEINFKDLADIIISLPTNCFQEVPKYPPVVRDLSFVVAPEILYNDLRQEIVKFNPLIVEAELFDVYNGNKLANNQKSLAFHLTYRSEKQTLVAAEVDIIQQGLIEHLAKKFSAKLRDF
ncbi:MAG: phenylalanine--tRNA ligase subunit beta [Patescibacteria group bacterium]|jgi:phenylalanyl-tRNA synthetase beta chain